VPIKKSEVIWFDGKLVPWDEAKVHVLSHVMHYGSSVFEGIRCYETESGPAVFRLDAHLRRMMDSCRVYRMDIPFTRVALANAILETIRANHLASCYIRPLVFRGYGELGVSPLNCPVQVIIAAWEWGAYLGAEALEQGVEVGVSSWRRMAPDTFPASVKAGGHYANSQLMKMEAIRYGYAESIALDVFGYVSEGSGENLFLIRDAPARCSTSLTSCSSRARLRRSRPSVQSMASSLGLVGVVLLPLRSNRRSLRSFLARCQIDATGSPPFPAISRVLCLWGQRLDALAFAVPTHKPGLFRVGAAFRTGAERGR